MTVTDTKPSYNHSFYQDVNPQKAPLLDRHPDFFNLFKKMIKKNILWLALFSFFMSACSTSLHKMDTTAALPELEMPGNHLKFNEISGYKNYKLVATHYRTDKKELRYVLANKIAFKAFSKNKFPLPEGSKVVKIGWKADKMPKFGVAIEATEIQRIEYMIKDSKQFGKNPGGWGYARFIKQNGQYSAWDKGTNACIQCHNIAGREKDFLFSQYQKMY
jgi:hypothetical protein